MNRAIEKHITSLSLREFNKNMNPPPIRIGTKEIVQLQVRCQQARPADLMEIDGVLIPSLVGVRDVDMPQSQLSGIEGAHAARIVVLDELFEVTDGF